jgi:hypothetical protein
MTKNEASRIPYGIRGGLAHDAGSGSFVSWDNTRCNPLAPAREQARNAWLDGYASGVAAEREACAKVCEDSVEYAGDTLAQAIRARGQA